MRIDINNNWLWSPVFEEDMIRPAYQMVSCYRKTIEVPYEWKDKKVFVTFDAVAHEAEVYVNGVSVVKHSCGYTAFTADLTEHIKFGEKNVITVKCDSRESLNVPPFGFVIDYMTYGGIYRISM